MTKHWLQVSQDIIIIVIIVIIILAELGIELRTLCLLSRHSTT
jgi:hypothetical protein